VLGARSRLNETSKVYTEYLWEEQDGGGRVTSLVGAQRQWDPLPGLRFVASLESSSVDADDGAGGADHRAVFTSLTWRRDRIVAFTRNGLRFDDRERDLRQITSSSQLDWAWTDEVSAIFKYRASSTEDRTAGVDEAELEERVVGVAYRPVDGDRWNALFRWSWLHDERPVLVAGGPNRDTWEVLSLDTTWRLHDRVDWLSKVLTRRLEETSPDVGDHSERHNLLVQRLDVDVRRPIEVGLEYRVLAATELEDRSQGWLLESGWRLHQNFRLGVGYNFTDFTDELYPQNDYSVQGWFLRVQGMY
jgi:hypothetical protein